MKRILYVNHKPSQCGVYEFGKLLGNLLVSSSKFNVKYCECSTLQELGKHIRKHDPIIVLYNYHPNTMEWVHRKKRYSVPLNKMYPVINIGTVHEVYQKLADNLNNSLFDFHVAPDPTLILKNTIVFKTGRLLPAVPDFIPDTNTNPVIGSFGFGTSGKGFEKIVKVVQQEFDIAHIRLNIPFATYGDPGGINARKIGENCINAATKNGITIEITHDYLTGENLLAFLRSNTINVFLYDDMPGRGISSAVDWAMASGRPLAISSSRLFRHLFNLVPSIDVEKRSLKEIINTDFTTYQGTYDDFSSSVILWEYEIMFEKVLTIANLNSINKRSALRYYYEKIKNKLGFGKWKYQIKKNVWTKPSDDYSKGDEYSGIIIPYNPFYNNNLIYNRILDNSSRELYRPAIKYLNHNFPKLIAKKIPEANIQQAFVFDSAVRLTNENKQIKSLAVGSFEDTAFEALKLAGYNIEEIDPVINYDLNTFLSKPTTKPASYDLIISTSVIEHVENDGLFIADIEKLLKIGGIAILTCDFKNGYKQGDDIPSVDYRFYTKDDIINRLMGYLPNSVLIDTPNYACENPDFTYLGKYVYTFASIVFKRIR